MLEQSMPAPVADDAAAEDRFRAALVAAARDGALTAASYRQKQAPLLGLLVAAGGPVPEPVLLALLGLDAAALAQRARPIGALVACLPAGWSLSDPALAEWLTDAGRAGLWWVDAAAGRRMLAAWLWEGFVAGAPGPAAEAFLIAAFPRLMGRTPEDLTAHLAALGGWRPGVEAATALARRLLAEGAGEAAALWWQVAGHLAEAGLPDPSALQAAHAAGLQAGDVLRAAPDRLADAVAAYRWAQLLAAPDPEAPAWLERLAIGQERIGDVLRAQGNLPRAGAAYRAGLALRGQLLAAGPSEPIAARRDLAGLQGKAGDLARAEGELREAGLAYRAAVELREAVVQHDPAAAESWRALSAAQAALADLLRAEGSLAEAAAAYQAALGAGAQVAALAPGAADDLGALAGLQEKLGDLLRGMGDLAGADAAYGAALGLRVGLATAAPQDRDAQAAVAALQERRGDLLRATGDLDGAGHAYRAAITPRERLVAAARGDATAQHALSLLQDKYGDLLRAQGDLTGASTAYRAGLAARQRLAAAAPANAEWQRDLFTSLWNLVQTAISAEDAPTARTLATVARAHARLLVDRFPGRSEFGRLRAAAEQEAEALGLPV